MDATTFRWVLAIIGLAILGLLLLLGNPGRKRKPRASRRPPAEAERREPVIDPDGAADSVADEAEFSLEGQGELPIREQDESVLRAVPGPEAPPRPQRPRKPAGPPPELIISLFLVAREDHRISGANLLQAALKTGMEFGDMDIFHRRPDGDERPVFSLANAVKPGYFDREAWKTCESRALVRFLALPGPMLALDAWDAMLATARRMAELLNVDLHDEQHQPLNRQAEAKIRESMRQFDREQARKSLS